MTARQVPTSALRARLRRLLTGGLSVAILVAPMTSAPSEAALARGASSVASAANPVLSDITMVQANIYTGLSVTRFQKDVAKVLSLQPDFVTYNEVSFRSDAVMAPEGYSLWRKMRNRFTSAAPVAWRSDRWTAIDQGTFRISNWRGKPPGRQTELGRRFANWVTLQGVDGRVVSVVSNHVAPLVNGMPDLLRPSVERLGVLTDRLSLAGPVLVGGDFNVHYKSGRYPRDLLEQHGLIPTFDTMGNYFATGDHQGATIDFVFNRGADQLATVSHYPVELNSDHDAVVAGLSWAVDLPSETSTVRSNPAGDDASRLAVLRTLKAGINQAPLGSTVRVATSVMHLNGVRARLIAAARRGVTVRVSIIDKRLTDEVLTMRRKLRRADPGNSWVRRCKSTCAEDWRSAYSSRTLMLVSDASGAWATRYDASRWMTAAVVERSTRLSQSVGENALRQAGQLITKLG